MRECESHEKEEGKNNTQCKLCVHNTQYRLIAQQNRKTINNKIMALGQKLCI